MVEGKFFKTKLCQLYRQGRCSRHTCSFAHGDSDLRRSFPSSKGGRDYRSGDSRVKFDDRHSLQGNFSMGRNARARDRFSGHSPSRPLNQSDRKRRKKQLSEEQSDFVGSLRNVDGMEDQDREENFISSDSKVFPSEKLKEVQSDIDRLDNRRGQLEISMEEKVQEADILTSRIEELETQLQKEEEEAKRITSKIQKFVRAYTRYSRAQEDLKRSQARLQKVGYQLGSDVSRAAGSEEDLSINIIGDEEVTHYHLHGSGNKKQTITSPKKKKPHVSCDNGDVAMSAANLRTVGGAEFGELEKFSRWSLHTTQTNINSGVEAGNYVDSNHRPVVDEGKQKGEKNVSASFSFADKSKGSGSGHILPSTGMAAHAINDIEIETEKLEDVEITSSEIEKGATSRRPPPPPVPPNTYLEYEVNEEDVDVDEHRR